MLHFIFPIFSQPNTAGPILCVSAMFQFLDRIKSLPEWRRRQFVWVGTILITGVIFLLWLGTLKLQFDEPTEKFGAATSSPLEVVKNNFSQMIDSLGRVFDLDQFKFGLEEEGKSTTTPGAEDLFGI